MSSLTGVMVPPNKAIVGANAFAHSSGIHQDGILKFRQTYEIMDPADVGIEETSLLLTVAQRPARLGEPAEASGLQTIEKEAGEMFVRFKALADKKRYVFDDDLLALMEEETAEANDDYTLEYLQTSSGPAWFPRRRSAVKTRGRRRWSRKRPAATVRWTRRPRRSIKSSA